MSDEESSTSTNSAAHLALLLPPAYHYCLWPDYQTSFVWHESDWPGNPEGEYDAEEDQLESRYSAAWCNARQAWIDHYIVAFESQECNLGSNKEPFPDPEPRRAWFFEGILLSCWLMLRRYVARVSYDAASRRYLLIKGEHLGPTLLGFLRDLRHG
ncbi:hypothetical protein BKA67DRAFT_539080 [Truncatella angustata]|uniref:Uncharacterized protein n=1 Tax=Truncatella angustata TaxID=152316 RepID=A0A9P8UFS3_9PEZI|nr:uncharacterized protein BKA67DRAFT_539080 [Truncatella angustata]KAH6649084.1 hypothetical protein BKA67DRAFT_539080 [Truncatella angustata]KAH8197914.1 hypothetical protein TruAng_007917 [Truncatella angustata]